MKEVRWMAYEAMQAPFLCENFSELKKKEAQEYFDWYISQKDERIQYLQNYINIDREDIVLDFSEQSLIRLWEWFETKIKLIKKGIIEYWLEVKSSEKWMKPFIKKATISDETIAIGLDIAIYFAEVLRLNSGEKLYWGFFTKPKNRFGVNEPVILGFEDLDEDLNPRNIVNNLTLKSSKEKDKNRLYDAYYVWKDYI